MWRLRVLKYLLAIPVGVWLTFGLANAQPQVACDALPAFEIVERPWVNDAHRQAVAALELPFGDERINALTAADTAMGALASEIERNQGQGATLAIVRADWATIARAAGSQTYVGSEAEELRRSLAVLLEAASTREEADYTLELAGRADATDAEMARAAELHRQIFGNDIRQLSAISLYLGRSYPPDHPSMVDRAVPESESIPLSRLMRSIASELQSGRGVYEADAMLLWALIETGSTDEAVTLAEAFAPDAIARLERTWARIEADPETDPDLSCWLEDRVLANISKAVADVMPRAELEKLLFWEGIEIALFAETETDYFGASYAFADLLALRDLGDERYRDVMRIFALAHYRSHMAYALEVGKALSGGEVYTSMAIPEIATEFYRDAKRWSGAGSETSPAVRFEVLVRALRFEWVSGNTSSVNETMAEAGALIRSHGTEIDPVLRVLYHTLEAEIMEARLEDQAAADALARAIDISLAEVPDPFDARNSSLEFRPGLERLLGQHLNGEFCADCVDTLADPLVRWWNGSLAYERESTGEDDALPDLAYDILYSDAPPAVRVKGAIEIVAPDFGPQSWWLSEEDLGEESPDRHREALRSVVDEFASNTAAVGATVDVFTRLDRDARLLSRAGDEAFASALFEEMLRLSEPDHGLDEYDWTEPDDRARLQLAKVLAPAYARRGRTAFSGGDHEAANQALDNAMDLMTRRLAQEWRAGNEQAALLFRQASSTLHLSAQLRFLLALTPDAADRFPGIRDRAFADMQLAMLGETALTMQTSIRNRILEDDDLREAILERDSALDRMRRLDVLESMLPSRLPWVVEEARARTGDEIEAASQAVARRLTISEDFAALDPLTPFQVADALRPSEALAVLHAGTSVLYGFILRPDRDPFMYTVRAGRQELTERIAQLRKDASSFGAVDLANAAALHEALLGPAHQALDGIDHLIVVADGPLPGLPWSMLLSGEPSDALIDDAVEAEVRGAVSLGSRAGAAGSADWSAQPWLIRTFPVSVAPSVASLVAQRNALGASRAAYPFLGVGDPVLRGGRTIEAVEVASLFTRSGEINLAVLADLAPLPETADELSRLSEVLEAAPGSLLLGKSATESELKARVLSDYRVIAFATHGILAGEVAGTVEPGLVLTPEPEGVGGNDGYLALSEIMALKLDADLVILSACNTGGADGRPRAEWMSGLARGFISAGARRMLVTLWSIPSEPTTRLITGTAAAHAGVADWPKALQTSVLAMIDEPAQPIDAHPASWAGFVMLGVGD